MNEKKEAGASYIINLYQHIQLLTGNYSNYCNLYAELEARRKADDESEELIGEITQHPDFQEVIQALRHSINQTYMMYAALSRKLKITSDDYKKLESLHKNLVIAYMPLKEEVQEYVEIMNYFIVDQIIQDLLESSNDFIMRLTRANEQQ